MKKQNVNLSGHEMMKMSRRKKFIRTVRCCSFILLFSFSSMILFAENSYPFSDETVQQQLTVTGVVSDTYGDPLPGVSIMLKGTTQGTATDANGAFSLQVPNENATLVFSFIGFVKQEIVVGNRRSINVTLADDTRQIEEVVVIGYGSVKKANLTSSVSKINNEAIAERPITQLSDALAGQLAGVQAKNTTGLPGEELVIRIRGMNSVNGESPPLYVIDGVPRESMTDINPSDVASIQILKDASASAIYGARGANGVVLIETKRGAGKPSITLDAYFGLQSPERVLDMMNADEYRAFSVYYRNENYLRAVPTGTMYEPMSSRPVSYQIHEAFNDPNRKNVDWQEAILQNGPMQNYQLAASGSNDMGNIYVSGGYFDQEGIIKYTYYQRFNFRVNGELKLGKRLRAGVNIAPSFTKSDKADSMDKESAYNHALQMSPLIQLNEHTNTWGYVDGLGTYPNPIEQLKHTKQQTDRSKIFSMAWAEIDILEGLLFRSQFSYNHDTEVYEFFQPGDITYRDYGYLSRGNSNSQRWRGWVIQNTLTYTKAIKNHEFNVLLGQSADMNDYYYIFAEKTGWPTEEIPTLNVATTPTGASTRKNRYTTASVFGRLSYAYMDKYLLNASVRRDGSSRFGANKKWGVFPSVSAGWKISEESFLQDNDWMSLLKIRAAWGQAGNDRIGNYEYIPTTASANAVFNDVIVPGYVPARIRNDNLQWERNSTFDVGFDLSLFKNRLQFNFDYYVNTTDNLLYNVTTPSTSGFDIYRANMGTIENRGWEIDMTSFNTTGDFKWTTSLNLSRNRNKVLSLGLDDTPIYESAWDARVVTQVGGPICQFYVYRTDGLLTDNDFTTDANGNRVALVPIWAGQEPYHVKYVDSNGDGVCNADDLVAWGNNLPDLIYGFTNRFSYKGFELSVLLQGQFGGQLMWLGQRQIGSPPTGTNRGWKLWLHSYKPDYDEKYPGRGDPIPYDLGVDMTWDGKTPYLFGSNMFQNNDDRRVYSTTFLKIKNITLAYDLPGRMTEKIHMKGAKVYVSVDNLHNWNNYPGSTPEGSGGFTQNRESLSPSMFGIDYVTYPVSKRFVLGLNVNF